VIAVREGVALAPFTTLGIGGPAARFACIASVAELREVGAAPHAGRILARNAYGWFERVERGSYRLRDVGRAAVAAWDGAEPGADPVAGA